MALVCRTAIKEGATSREKKVGQDQGEQGRQREAASASGLRTDICIGVLSVTHTHTHKCSCLSALLPRSSQQKQIPTQLQSQSVSSVRMKRRVRETEEVRCPRISHT